MVRIDVNVNDVRQYIGRNIEVKTGNFQKEKVCFKVQADYSTIKDAADIRSANIVAVQYIGRPDDTALEGLTFNNAYTYCVYDIGDTFTDSEIKTLSEINPNLNIVIPLSREFKDVRRLWVLSTQFKNVRYTGGRLLSLDGVNVGEIPIERYRGVKITDLTSQDFVKIFPFGELVIDDAKEVKSSTGTRQSKPKVRRLSFADLLKRS